jgi:pyruvate kinase
MAHSARQDLLPGTPAVPTDRPLHSAAPLSELEHALESLRKSMLAFADEHKDLLTTTPQYRTSAENLLHYLAMRRQDIRALQPKLATLGLSSLGRAESYALAAVEAVLRIVHQLSGSGAKLPEARTRCDHAVGRELLETHTTALFGRAPQTRRVRIMVTMPTEAACDYTFVRNLIDAGMDCMRINCAHDEPAAWSRMIEHLQQACRTSGRKCTVLMDLAGPKLRTGDVEPGPAVRKLRPKRDVFGRVTAPAVAWLTSSSAPAAAPSIATNAVLQVEADWLAALRLHEKLELFDTRGRRRVLRVVDRDRGGVWAELRRTAYVSNGTSLRRATAKTNAIIATELAGIAPSEGVIRLAPGDLLILMRESSPGRGPSVDSAGKMLSPARVSCTLPEVFTQIQAGERICFDDGKISGVAESVSAEEIRVRVRRTPARGGALRADKGINLPDSNLELPALTTKDKADLEFIVRHADLVGLSFVNRESDVRELIEALQAQDGARLGIVLKIETQRAFSRLPALLLALMQHDRIGVMIARGDLAVECGYERLAEVQEEILWICEAAHCPAIWATQVLETLAKAGVPSRAEITDAAMGHRAECVMLNKGPHVDAAVRALDDILRRMDAHQRKKRSMLRSLGVATRFGT